MITELERAQIETMMRITVALQGMCDALLLQGNMLLNANPNPAEKQAAPQMPHGAVIEDDPNDPPRLMRQRATIPKPEG